MVVQKVILGTLSIDNETDYDDASQPRQTESRVSFLFGEESEV